MQLSTQSRFAHIALGGTVLLLLSLLGATSAEAQIDTYRVLLKNGNTFTSVERPRVADFDSNMILIRSLGGHVVGLQLDQIEKVESDLEFQGFGTLINKTTILVGSVANDAIEPGEGDLDAALGAGGFESSLAEILLSQPFFANTEPQAVAPVASGPPTLLQAPVYDIPRQD